MEDELIKFLGDKIYPYMGKDYTFAYILNVLRGEITTWLFEQHKNPKTYSLDQKTLIAVKALCRMNVRI